MKMTVKLVNAKWTEGKYGQALEFDGSAQVQIPPSESIDDFREGFIHIYYG